MRPGNREPPGLKNGQPCLECPWTIPYHRSEREVTSRGCSDVRAILHRVSSMAIDRWNSVAEDPVPGRSPALVDSLQGGRGWRTHYRSTTNEHASMGS